MSDDKSWWEMLPKWFREERRKEGTAPEDDTMLEKDKQDNS